MVQVPEIPKVETVELPAKETALIVVDMPVSYTHLTLPTIYSV